MSKVKRTWKSITCRTLVRVFLFAWVLTIIFPLYWMLATSLKSSKVFMAGDVWGWPNEIFIVNYIKAWVEARMNRYIFNTIYVSLATTVIYAVMVSTTSYILAKYTFKFVKFFKDFYFFAMIIPLILLTYQIFYQLHDIHLTDNLFVLAVVYAVQALPAGTFLITAFISGINKGFVEAAKIDGASEFRIFVSVIIPFIVPILLFECLGRFIGAWNEYLTAYTFLTSSDKWTLSAGIQRVVTKFTYESNYGVIFASLTLSLIPILVLYLMFQKVILHGTDISDGLK